MKTSKDYPQTEYTGIILAGGKSSRMGMDKGLVLYRGKPLITYSINLLSPFCKRILLSASIVVYDHLGLERVTDEFNNYGPMAGLYSCLRKSTTEINICLPCDVPEIPVEVIATLIEAAKENPGKCIVPLTPLPEPLIAVYPLNVISVIEGLISRNEFKMTRIFDLFPVKYIPFEEFSLKDNKDIFMNINNRKDLR
ncbi:MAG TPA: molybdenum cofactor guanylyltransferase [Lentimicrobium sp.]|nr:molybdenum cofactor guanylyltransferase [Lentimicrobium sp.]